MKKIIIIGYFVLSLILTYIITLISAYTMTDDVMITYEKIKRRLPYTEVEKRNIKHKSGHHVEEIYDLKYTYIKKPFGFEIQKDTVSSETFYYEN